MSNLNLALSLLRQRLTAATTVTQTIRNYAVKPAAAGAGELSPKSCVKSEDN